MAESRTYGPTPRRLAEARAEGRVAKSPLLAAGLVCLALGSVGGSLVTSSQALLARGFAGWGVEIGRIGAGQRLEPVGLHGRLMSLLVPWLGLGLAIALGGSMLQLGLRWTPRALGASTRRSLPWPGRARLDPAELSGEVAVLALAVAAGFGTLAVLVDGELAGLVALTERSPGQALELFGALLARLLLVLGGWLCALAALDWARRRQALLRSLRMTRSELRREQRELEADPRLRRRRQQEHRAGMDGPAS